MPAVAPAMPAIMAGMGAVSSVVQYQSQAKIADASKKQQAIQNEEIVAGAVQSYGDLNASEEQAVRQSLMDGLNLQIEATQERATQRLFSSASGTMGNSVDVLMSDIAFREGQNMDTIVRNRDASLQSVNRQAESIRMGAQRNQGTRSFNRPSALAAGLDTISGAASGYLAGSQIKDRVQ